MILTREELEPLMTRSQVAKYVAAYLRVSAKNVYDRYVFMQGFPEPILIPSPTGKKPAMRWDKNDINAWLPIKKQAA